MYSLKTYDLKIFNESNLEGKMIKIMLACSAGMSTSLLVTKWRMQQRKTV